MVEYLRYGKRTRPDCFVQLCAPSLLSCDRRMIAPAGDMEVLCQPRSTDVESFNQSVLILFRRKLPSDRPGAQQVQLAAIDNTVPMPY